MSPLLPHPSAPAPPGVVVHAEATRDRGVIRVRHVLSGALDAVRFSEERTPARLDGLWKSTCFEAFLQTPGASGYWEINAAPSRDWAAYAFDAYRGVGMRAAPFSVVVDRVRTADQLTVTAAFTAPSAEPLSLGLACVLENHAGGLSYWALAHGGDRPDFHNAVAFVSSV